MKALLNKTSRVLKWVFIALCVLISLKVTFSVLKLATAGAAFLTAATWSLGALFFCLGAVYFGSRYFKTKKK